MPGELARLAPPASVCLWKPEEPEGCEVKTGGARYAIYATISGVQARSPGPNASRGTPQAVHSAPFPPRRAVLAPIPPPLVLM